MEPADGFSQSNRYEVELVREPQCFVRHALETHSTFDLINYLSDAGIYVNLFQLIDYIKSNEITKKVLLTLFHRFSYNLHCLQLHGFVCKYPVAKCQSTEGNS